MFSVVQSYLPGNSLQAGIPGLVILFSNLSKDDVNPNTWIRILPIIPVFFFSSWHYSREVSTLIFLCNLDVSHPFSSSQAVQSIIFEAVRTPKFWPEWIKMSDLREERWLENIHNWVHLSRICGCVLSFFTQHAR